ncbi:NUDIX hydrolase [Vibrio sp. S4M6]|uniref:NUDIX hydrolase n=1 Tax=Vibrio sinus TaxID=2946865 RepID=UPI00202AAC84|nr:NUDIX hydrolase [Vibrio sinus]MCL9779976.1 NUDIX hydrolase [Vibrio sinus]
MNKLIHTWKRISLVENQIILPNNKTIEHTTIVHPGAAVILPITNSGDIVLVRQFRPSLRKWLLELPAGTLEENETTTECAMRELKEETGFTASNLVAIGQVTPMAGFCDEIQHLFVATELTHSSELNCDDDEVIEVVTMSLDEIEQCVIEDKITDAKTIACISKAKLLGYL